MINNTIIRKLGVLVVVRIITKLHVFVVSVAIAGCIKINHIAVKTRKHV